MTDADVYHIVFPTVWMSVDSNKHIVCTSFCSRYMIRTSTMLIALPIVASWYIVATCNRVQNT